MNKPIHSPTGASSYYRWKQCPGSIRLCSTVPKTQAGEAAQRGSHAHSIAEEVLTGRKPLQYFEVFEDPTLLSAVKIYIDLVRSEKAKEEKHGYQYGIETPFDMSESIAEGLYGTTDFWIYRHRDKSLTIIDYKNGKTKVEVEQNEQLLFYALGAMLTLPYHVETIELVICQPNASGGAIRRWAMPSYEIYEFIAELKQDVEKTKDPNAPLNAGSWCYFCDAVFICPEKRALRLLKASSEFEECV